MVGLLQDITKKVSLSQLKLNCGVAADTLKTRKELGHTFLLFSFFLQGYKNAHKHAHTHLLKANGNGFFPQWENNCQWFTPQGRIRLALTFSEAVSELQTNLSVRLQEKCSQQNSLFRLFCLFVSEIAMDLISKLPLQQDAMPAGFPL